MIRLMILVSLLSLFGCSQSSTNKPPEKSLVGAWKIFNAGNLSPDTLPATESTEIGGYLIFKRDNTFDGSVLLKTASSEDSLRNQKFSGTYLVEGNVITITPEGKKPTKSTFRFRDGFLILMSLEGDTLLPVVFLKSAE